MSLFHHALAADFSLVEDITARVCTFSLDKFTVVHKCNRQTSKRSKVVGNVRGWEPGKIGAEGTGAGKGKDRRWEF